MPTQQFSVLLEKFKFILELFSYLLNYLTENFFDLIDRSFHALLCLAESSSGGFLPFQG